MDINIKIITEIINKILPKCEIILFGSRASKSYTDESDYDILIISEKQLSIQEKRKLQAQIRRKIAEHLIPADILIQNKEEFNKKKTITGHIVKQIANEGIVI